MRAKDLAYVALDDCLPDDYTGIRSETTMKVKTTFYYNRKNGKEYDPLIKVRYPKSRADQLSYQPTSKLIDQMVRTGQLVQASKAQFDFPDGKDDGRSVPIDRIRGLDYPEISQALAEQEQKLEGHKNAIKAMADKKGEKTAASTSDGTSEQGSDASGTQ